MKVTFGEWVRWTLARRDLDRSAVAERLGISTKSVTNLYRRDDPDGVSDVTLSRLASLLAMSEPDLLQAWRAGLPAAAAPAAAATPREKKKKAAGKKK